MHQSVVINIYQYMYYIYREREESGKKITLKLKTLHKNIKFPRKLILSFSNDNMNILGNLMLLFFYHFLLLWLYFFTILMNNIYIGKFRTHPWLTYKLKSKR